MPKSSYQQFRASWRVKVQSGGFDSLAAHMENSMGWSGMDGLHLRRQTPWQRYATEGHGVSAIFPFPHKHYDVRISYACPYLFFPIYNFVDGVGKLYLELMRYTKLRNYE